MLLALLCRPWALAACAFVLVLPAAAQGTLAGTVADGSLGETLPGANVLVVETGTGTATDLDGAYRVALPAGTYTVRYSFVGFDAQTVTGVVIRDGQATDLNVVLSAGQLGEVVVEAEAILETNSDVGLDRVRAGAAAVSDAISAETIAQSGAANAGDAMERVTGASVQGGRYVYVRGLGDRYATTQLNGSTLPTADPDRRAVQFDLFPSTFLDHIVTLKTFTPDRPGSFSGGLVDITTRAFPTEFTASLSFSSGASTLVSPGGAILVDPAAGVALFGRADALDLPDELAHGGTVPLVSRQEVFNPDASPERLAAIEANERLVDHFTQRSVAPAAGTAAPNMSVSASVGNQVRLWGNPLGFVLGVTSDRGVGSYTEGTVGRYDVSGADAAPRLRSRRRDQRSTVESSLGGIGNLTYRLSNRHEVGLNTLFSQTAESQARVLSGLAPLPIGAAGDSIFVTDRVTGYAERRLASGQLRGRHDLPALAGLRAEWRASLSSTSLDEPDLRFFANAQQDSLFQVGGASLNNTLHFFRESTEGLRGLGLDLTLPARALAGLPVQLRAGALREDSRRAFRERRFEILSEGLTLDGDDAASVDAFFSDANTGVIEVRPANTFDPQQRATYVLGHRLVDGTQPTNQYDGLLDVTAAYAMAEFPLTRALRVIGGARFEQTRLGIDVVDLATGEVLTDSVAQSRSGRIRANDWLPSLNLVYALSPRMNLRAAATRTLARPTFREIAPFESFDTATSGPTVGNPDLDRTLITNLDLRWEWFNVPGSILAVSGYYKALSQPIERVIVDFENNVSTFSNVDRATILGAEIEARQSLGTFLDRPWLRHLSLGANLTLTESTISIDEVELAERRRIDPDAADTRALQGQSPYIVNVDVAYENPATETAAGFYFNVFGPRLARVGVPDVVERSNPQLDFVASQRLFGQFTLKATVRNLLGSSPREVYDFPESTWGAIGGAEPVYQAYDLGTSFSIGLSFSPRVGGGRPAVPAVPSPAATMGTATL